MPGRASGPPGIQFGPGSRGVNRQIPVHLLDADELFDCNNMMFLNGSLQPRPGLLPIQNLTGGGTAIWPDRPMGSTYFVQDDLTPTIVVSTLTSQYKLEGLSWTSWVDITQGASTTPVLLTGTSSNPVRFTPIQHTGLPTIVMANGVDHLKGSIDGAEFVDFDAGGTLPKFIDLTTVANRVVGVYSPYGIRWSDLFNPTTWPASNFRNLSDTGDRIIAVRKLGTQAMVIYKLFNLWVGYSQAGSPANAFRFDWKGEFESPASQAAIVDTGGCHYYLSRTGRIGRFDGVTHSWVADGVWPILQADMDPSFAAGAHGIYHSAVPAIIFYYCRQADIPPACTGLVILTLPRPQLGIMHHGAFPGVSSQPVATGTMVDLAQFGIFSTAMTHTSANVLWGAPGTGDQGTDFNCHAQTGLKAIGSVARVEIEPFVERGVNYGEATLSVVTSNVLDSPGGTLGNSSTVDLEDTTLVRDPYGFEATGRFAGLKIACTSDDTLHYKGATVSGHQLESI